MSKAIVSTIVYDILGLRIYNAPKLDADNPERTAKVARMEISRVNPKNGNPSMRIKLSKKQLDTLLESAAIKSGRQLAGLLKTTKETFKVSVQVTDVAEGDTFQQYGEDVIAEKTFTDLFLNELVIPASVATQLIAMDAQQEANSAQITALLDGGHITPLQMLAALTGQSLAPAAPETKAVKNEGVADVPVVKKPKKAKKAKKEQAADTLI